MKYYLKVILEHFAFGLMIPISISWKLSNGLSLGQAAFTESLILVATAIVEIPAGVIADKIGNKKSLLIGGIFQAIATVLLVAGGSLTVFVFAAICSGIGWAFSSGADEAYIHDDFLKDGKEYQKIFANVTIADEAATVGGMLLASAILFENPNMRWPLLASALLLIAHALYVQFALPESQKPAPKKAPQNTVSLAHIKNAFRQALPIVPLLVSLAVIYESGRVLWQPHMQNIGLDIASFGLFFALFKAAAIIGSLVAKHRNFGVKDLALTFPLMLVTLVAFGVDQKMLSILALTLFLATENYFRVYMSTVLNKAVVHNRATMLSIASSFRNILGSGLVFATGLVATRSLQLALSVLALAKLPAIVYLLYKHYRVRADGSSLADEPASI